MTKTFHGIVLAAGMLAGTAFAQDDISYIQIEARTSLSGAQESVQTYLQSLQDVNGFALGGGWYGVALGPYSRTEAEALLRTLRRQGLVPADAYIEDAAGYGQQFWPVGAQGAQAPVPAPLPAPAPQTAPEPVVVAEPAPAPEQAPEPEPVVDETPREARASERQLDRAQREELQIALKWAGVYAAGIDGAFGRGTRNAMAQWQEANSFEVTGILTTMQRAELLRQYNAVLEGMGMAAYADPRVGVSMDLPLGAVSFDRFEAPFALFQPTGIVDGARVLLISQPGDRATMNGLYEIMQTLEIVPLEGDRERRSNGFLLTGANDRIVSHTEVTLRDNQIKGYTLIWPAGDEERRTRVLGLMQASFERTDGVLDPASVTDDGQSVDLVSGLQVRKPKLSASGFFVDDKGTVLTSANTVAACERVTIEGVYDADVVARDDALGVALLRPQDSLAPRGIAGFKADNPRISADVAVAGYPFGGVLGAPTLTFGTLEDLQGLGGETNMKRLALAALPGDTGGPVLDADGSVLGMLLPRQEDGARRLPEDVSFAAKGDLIVDFLGAQGMRAGARSGGASLAPEDLTALATQMTVLVSCWD